MDRQKTEKRLQALVPAAMKNRIKVSAAEHEEIGSIDRWVKVACIEKLKRDGFTVPENWLD